MFSIINLNKLDDILILYTASTGLSFFVISVTHLAIPLLAWVIFIHDKADTLNSEGFKNVYGTITDGLALNGVISKYWNIFVLLRWSVVSQILVIFRDNPSFQI